MIVEGGGVDSNQTIPKRAQREQRNKYKPRTETSTNKNKQKNKGTPPWGGCGFSTIVYLVIESKITFLHCNLQYFMLVIYDVLTFAARCQNAIFFCNSATSAWGSMHSFLHRDASSVASSYSRKERYHPTPTPPPGQGSKTSATKLGNVSSVASSYNRKERYHPPPPPHPPSRSR